MDWKYHTLFGIVFTFIAMIIINLSIAINNSMMAIDVLTVLFPFTELQFWLYAIPIIILYSLLPDMDHKNSKITGFFYFVGFSIIMISYLTSRLLQLETMFDFGGMVIYGLIIMLSTWVISNYFKHRGHTHTLWFGIVATGLLLIVGIDYIIYYIIAFISFWSHLFADKIPFKITNKPKSSMFK